MKKKIALWLIYAAFIFLLFSGLEAKEKKWHLGLYGGWSLGMDGVFQTEEFPNQSYSENISFQLGSYLNVHTSQRFALQIEVNYQHFSHELHQTGSSGVVHKEGSDPFFSVYLDFVNYLRPDFSWNPHVVAGLGLGFGELRWISGEEPETFLAIQFGFGAKPTLGPLNLNILAKIVYMRGPPGTSFIYPGVVIGVEF